MLTLIKRKKAVNNNSLFTIFPYKLQGQWVFDDERVGLVAEAFVAGADTLLDKLTDNASSCTAIFSDSSFPDHQVALILRETSSSGSTYYCEKYKHELWLCPALFLYWERAPQNIYLKIKK